MPTSVMSSVLLLAGAALAAQPAQEASKAEAAPGVKIVKDAAISGKIEATPPSSAGRGGIFVEDEGWRVHVAERDRPGLAELHDAETDVWYVIAGGATVVTGGTLVDASLTGPGEHRAPAIRGGTQHAVAAGDVVTIAPGVPHWVKAVDGRLKYLVVKVGSLGRGRAGSHRGGQGVDAGDHALRQLGLRAAEVPLLAGVGLEVEDARLQGPEAFGHELVASGADGHRVVGRIDQELAAAVDSRAGQAGDVSAQKTLKVLAEIPLVGR
jgi:mannose-6-phosphate isomerase-like protein (cupin superfamily)